MQSETDKKATRELIEKVGKAYFDACRKIAKAVSRLKQKKEDR